MQPLAPYPSNRRMIAVSGQSDIRVALLSHILTKWRDPDPAA